MPDMELSIIRKVLTVLITASVTFTTPTAHALLILQINGSSAHSTIPTSTIIPTFLPGYTLSIDTEVPFNIRLLDTTLSIDTTPVLPHRTPSLPNINFQAPGLPGFCTGTGCFINNRPDFLPTDIESCESAGNCGFLPIIYDAFRPPVNVPEPNTIQLLTLSLLLLTTNRLIRQNPR